jgi:hypothetical protein
LEFGGGGKLLAIGTKTRWFPREALDDEKGKRSGPAEDRSAVI